ncbi:MAG: hypothetical protein FJ116_08850 [Deltaproteobacteria bacterium]|nr:hypothetical protein [Deltaproteobacteria bacterium]
MTLSKYGKVVIASFLGIWGVMTGIIVFTECRFPGSDVFLFKEAAINFALKNRLVASNLVYMPMDTEMPFAHYPPIYPLVFGVWLKVFGIGLKQSLFYECLLRGLRSVMLGMLIWPSLKSALGDTKRKIWATLLVGFLFGLSLVSTDEDRPDELGLILGFGCWWLLMKAKQRHQFLLVGGLLGLTAATSPAAGICMGLGVVVYHFSKIKQIEKMILVSLGCLSALFASLAPMLITHWEVMKRFSISARASSVPYPAPWSKGVTSKLFWSRIQYCAEHYSGVGFRLIFCLLCSLVVLFLLRQRKSVFQNSFQRSSLLFAFIAPLIWALQPYYLWFAILPIAIFFLADQLEIDRPQKAFAFLGIFVAFVPLFVHEMKNFIMVANRPLEESSSYIRQELLKEIKPDERVAVSFDQFFTLRNLREVANVEFVCVGLDKFDYIYVTRISSAQKGHPSAVPIPCWWSNKTKCFEPVNNFAQNYPLKIAGWDTGYVVRGNGGTLYKNTHCQQTAIKHVAFGESMSF